MSTHRSGAPLRKGSAREALLLLKNRIWSDSPENELTTHERVVLETLLAYSDDKRETFIGVAKISIRTRLSESTVRRALARLRQQGRIASVIETTSRGRRNRYRLLLEATTESTKSLDAPEPAIAAGSAPLDTTGSVPQTGSPSVTPSSDRIKFNDLPLYPQDATKLPLRRCPAQRPQREDFEAVFTVLSYFMARLHPDSSGPIITSDRKRIVEARLREFDGDVAKLRDAVDGAKLSRWHRESDIGYRADIVFRNADTIEQLASLARRQRIHDRRSTGQGRRPPVAPPVAVTALRRGPHELLKQFESLVAPSLGATGS